MIASLCLEIEMNREFFQEGNIETIYFGGGTPSLLPVTEVEGLLKSITSTFSVSNNPEITFELNPDDAEPAYLEALLKLGINRLSIGFQSFDNAELRWMNRSHDAAQNRTAIIAARKSGFSNISVDLIFGSKFQTLGGWKHTLQETIALRPAHISAYQLTIENDTVLGRRVHKKQEPIPDSDLCASMFEILMDEAEVAGYHQYEISNFSKPGFHSRHNSSYWNNSRYLGIGPSAHSYNGENRMVNPKSNALYMHNVQKGLPIYATENLSPNEKYNEYVLTRLRTSGGCNCGEIEKLFGKEYREHFETRAARHGCFVSIHEKTISLTRKGKFFADGIASDLFLIP